MPAGSFFPLGFDAPGAWILLTHFLPIFFLYLSLVLFLFSFFYFFLLSLDLRFEEEC